MENDVLGIFTAIALVFYIAWLTITKLGRSRRPTIKLPPGPMPWPVVGNMFQLAGGSRPHDELTKLARKHGPIMTLHLGSMLTVVISTSEAAREMFKNHDAPLAGRKIYEAMKGGKGSDGSLITAQYGAYWRMLRRLCTTQFFVTRRLDDMCGVRARCIRQMVRFVTEASQNGTKSIDVGRYFFLMAFNLIGNLMFSKDLLDPDSERGSEFFYHAGKVMEFAGKPNVADFFPFLRFLDPQGIRRKTQFHVERAFEIAGEFIKERMENTKNELRDEKTKDYLDVLLEFRGDGLDEPSRFSSRTINVIVFEMFTAGTDTTTSTLEWAMTELLYNQRTLTKLQAELRTYLPANRNLHENDLPNLPYLTAVIKETLRLHPPLPFLVPHKAMSTCHILNQYTIPKETQVLVNVWAIGRDPNKWTDPLIFRPERFLSDPNPPDFKGQDFEFLPFGSGRRICPALPLASRILPLALGSMVGSFDWALVDGLEAHKMDMGERMGITLRKAVPLEAIPIPHKGS